MNNKAEVLCTVAGIFMMFVALVVGWSAANEGWARDCKQLGARVHDGKIYECKDRK